MPSRSTPTSDADITLRFHLSSVPEDPSGYRLGAFTRGELRVDQASRCLFQEEDLLLVELVIALARWSISGRGPFSFTTMDEEEGPTLEWSFVGGQPATLRSVSEHRPGSPITPAALQEASRRLLVALQQELITGYGISLAPTLDANAPGWREHLTDS